MTTTAPERDAGATDDETGARTTPDDAAPSSARRFAYWLAGIAGVGLAVRMMNVYWWRPTTDRPGYLGYRLWGDAFYYHWQANLLADGKFFVDPVRYINPLHVAFQGPTDVASSGHPPLYTLYLTMWSLVGIDSVTAHRVVSSLLGVATIVVVGLVARRIAGNVAGLVAAGIIAVYPFMWINDGMLMSESLVVLLAALVLGASYAFIAKPDMTRTALLGLACGAAALTRSELLLLLPLLVVPLAFLRREMAWKRRIGLAAAACAVALAIIAPWVAYNMTRFEDPVFMSTGIGQTLQAGSCDTVFYGDLIGYYWPCYANPRSADRLDESQRDALLRDHALDYIDAHRDRVPLVALARAGRMWEVFKPGHTTYEDWWFEGRGRAPSWMALFFYYAMIPFVVFGIVTMWRRKISIVPVVAPAVIATIAAATTFGLPRYRAPAEVGLCLVAAIGIATAWQRLRARRVLVAERS